MLVRNGLANESFRLNSDVRFEFRCRRGCRRGFGVCGRWTLEVVVPIPFGKCITDVRGPGSVVNWVKFRELLESKLCVRHGRRFRHAGGAGDAE